MTAQRPATIYSGRCDDVQHGAYEAARMVREVSAERPVHLIVNGAAPETVSAARRLLSQVAGRAVEVRAFTTDKQAQRAAIGAADVVLVPSRAENVGLTALDAIVAEVPVLVPDTCGMGKFLVGSGRVDPGLAEHSVVRSPAGWVPALAGILADPDTARQRAAALRAGLVDAVRTLQSAGQSVADLLNAIASVRDRGEGSGSA